MYARVSVADLGGDLHKADDDLVVFQPRNVFGKLVHIPFVLRLRHMVEGVLVSFYQLRFELGNVLLPFGAWNRLSGKVGGKEKEGNEMVAFTHRQRLDGLMGVSWMTLLGAKSLNQVGGLQALNNALQPPIQVQPLNCKDGGALIIAGPKPLVGDMTIGDDLPLYKDVGRAVRAARFPGQFAGGGMDNDVAHKWFMRFFGDAA